MVELIPNPNCDAPLRRLRERGRDFEQYGFGGNNRVIILQPAQQLYGDCMILIASVEPCDRESGVEKTLD